jgi:hypothetical protein
MIKIFIGIFCFLAIFSCNNNDNISTAQINSITTTTIDDGLSATDGGVQSPQGSIGDAMATVEIRIHDAFGTDADVQQAQGRTACADAQVADDPCDKYELLKLKLLE